MPKPLFSYPDPVPALVKKMIDPHSILLGNNHNKNPAKFYYTFKNPHSIFESFEVLGNIMEQIRNSFASPLPPTYSQLMEIINEIAAQYNSPESLENTTAKNLRSTIFKIEQLHY